MIHRLHEKKDPHTIKENKSNLYAKERDDEDNLILEKKKNRLKSKRPSEVMLLPTFSTASKTCCLY